MTTYYYSDESVANRQKISDARINERLVPSQPLQPYFQFYPTSTKFTQFQTHDIYPKATVPVKQMPVFNVHTMFNPSNAVAPWSGYASKINVESDLKNINYSLQNCDQRYYVPSSNSDLYQSRWSNTKYVHMPHSELFNPSLPNYTRKHDNSNGYKIFNNDTGIKNSGGF